METTAFIITVLIWGILALASTAVTIFAIMGMVLEKVKWTHIVLIIYSLLFAGMTAYNFYVVLNKGIANPKINNAKEITIDGVNHVEYQDTLHLCDASDKNSTVFTSMIPANGTVSKSDTCIICGKSFYYHNTHQEQVYFDGMERISFLQNY